MSNLFILENIASDSTHRQLNSHYLSTLQNPLNPLSLEASTPEDQYSLHLHERRLFRARACAAPASHLSLLVPSLLKYLCHNSLFRFFTNVISIWFNTFDSQKREVKSRQYLDHSALFISFC
jgi:hypothetical protein